jgi:hypothetical protein
MRSMRLRIGSVVMLYLVCAFMAVLSFPVSADLQDADIVATQTATTDAATATEDVGLVDSVMAKIPEWVKLAGLLTTIFSVFAAATPTPKDDGIAMLFRKAVDLLAFNVGHAKSDAQTKRQYAIK